MIGLGFERKDGVSRPDARFQDIGMIFAYILLMETLYF
ncbi:hypothetical protein B4135_0603 [Caldibacillus debilis]|uniref:Uncharacterized protein n=1 Tax=Caldibacillus debilis TaxID=301148 RepID=A0A150MEU7_9BACI|nr:hypothetical protein B4135_0603 [Caldibacillus debilis]